METRYYSRDEMAILCQQLRPGYLLQFNRKSYIHWAVYTGQFEGTHLVVHFTMIESDRPGAARYTSAVLEQRIEDVWLNDTCRLNLSGDDNTGWTARSEGDILSYTISQLSGPISAYDIVSNNCEHFANMCRYRIAYSSQVSHATNVASGVGLGLAVVAGVFLGKEACSNVLHGMQLLSFLAPQVSPHITPHITASVMNNTDTLTEVKLMSDQLVNSITTVSKSIADYVIVNSGVQAALVQTMKWLAINCLNIDESRWVHFQADFLRNIQRFRIWKLQDFINFINKIRVATYMIKPVGVFAIIAVDRVAMVFQMASVELKEFVALLINEVGEFFGVGKTNINLSVAGIRLEFGLSGLPDVLKKLIMEIIKYFTV